jgi:predicted ATP-grasp superfamily ATP-dependent carboligase
MAASDVIYSTFILLLGHLLTKRVASLKFHSPVRIFNNYRTTHVHYMAHVWCESCASRIIKIHANVSSWMRSKCCKLICSISASAPTR